MSTSVRATVQTLMARTTTDSKGTTELVKVISVPRDHMYAAIAAKIVTVNTGPVIRGTICRQPNGQSATALQDDLSNSHCLAA